MPKGWRSSEHVRYPLQTECHRIIAAIVVIMIGLKRIASPGEPQALLPVI
jgi:hypothetical protein